MPKKQLTEIGKFTEMVIERFGENIIERNNDIPNRKITVIPTGSISLDLSTGIGGIPRGRFTEIYGPESCLAEDTFIPYEIKTKEGKRQNHKGGTIAHLYNRFHKIETSGQGYYSRSATKNSLFYVSSINENNCVIKNLIVDIVDTGIKPCYKLTSDGFSLVSTAEHKYYIGNGEYKPLRELLVGDTIYIHNNFTNRKQHKTLEFIRDLEVKYHTLGRPHIVNGCKYFRVSYSRVAFEAYANGYSMQEYRKILNSETVEFIDNLYHVPNHLDVHHVDKNRKNNSKDNLLLMTKHDHNKMHSKENIEYFSFIVKPYKIDSIEFVGEKKTYDIKCLYPYNNYIANKFVVHNSAKTSLCLSISKEAIRLGLKVLYVEPENALDYSYIQAIAGTIDTESFVLAQPETAEQALYICEAGIRSGEFKLVILDSVAALAPEAVLEDDPDKAHVGIISRKLPSFLQRNAFQIREDEVAFIFINQIRDIIGSYIGGVESPGGHALKHFLALRIFLNKAKDIEIIHDKDHKEKIGIYSRFLIKKNKLAKPYRSFAFPFIFGKGIDYMTDLVDFAEYQGVLEKRGAYFSFEGETLGQGTAKTVAFLNEHKLVLDKIKEKMYNSIMQDNQIELDESEVTDAEVA